MRAPLQAVLALLGALNIPAGTAHAARPDACAVPAETVGTPVPLEQVKAAIARGRLVVLAIGGIATVGVPDAGATYPERMRAHLAKHAPGLEVVLELRAAPDATPRQRAALLAQEIETVRPNLVVWASGSREAIRHSDPARYAASLRLGISRARAAGADVVLVEPQFAPGWARLPNIDTYRDTMRTVAMLEGVPMFPRFTLMQAWHEAGQIVLDSPDPVRQAEVARTVMNCIGTALAELVRRGAR